jgi:4-hydroxybenzoate polyprenyltransferase
LTQPPTNAERPPRESLRERLRQKAVVAYYMVEDFIPRPPNFAAWLRLVRAPNLLTVPGDILAGFLLAPAATTGDWGQLLLAIPAGLLLYAAGLILNDIFDYAEDLRERPARPLPSGAVSREAAVAVALICLWVAAFLAAFFDALPVALLLILMIILYDAGMKRHPVVGPLLMGGCRAANLLMGATVAADRVWAGPIPLAGALLLGIYIAGVTALARNETHAGTSFPPERIGRLLRMLIPLQALLGVAAIHRFPFNLLALVLLPLLPLHRRLARRFPPS